MSLWLPRSPCVVQQLRRRLSTSTPPLVLLHSSWRHQDIALPSLRHIRPVSTNPQKSPSPQNTPSSPSESSSLATAVDKPPLLPRVWKAVKDGASHYWHGSKLLVSEVRISGRLQWKLLHGEALTRREKRQVRCFIRNTPVRR